MRKKKHDNRVAYPDGAGNDPKQLFLLLFGGGGGGGESFTTKAQHFYSGQLVRTRF